MNNTLKTAFFLTALTILLVFLGNLVGGESGMFGAFIFACLMNFSAYWFSDKIILSMYRAQPISDLEAPEIYTIVRELAEKMNIPMPQIYLIPTAAPNAFATGRNPKHAAVCVTQGILDLLNREELKGVLAHELAHVQHRDILISSIAATLAGAISILASLVRWAFMFGSSRRDDREGQQHPVVLLVMALLMPIAASLIQLAVSRSREYAADEGGAHVSGNPLYLASALRKLESRSEQIPMQEATPETSHLFIVNPLTGRSFASLFMTHPPIEERIARLEKMARQEFSL